VIFLFLRGHVNDRGWPDSIDAAATLLFMAVVVVAPLMGYVFMAADLRAYWRSLRRQLVRVARFGQETPWWAFRENPTCLSSFGLRYPCTEEELKRAYRERVKQLHPDRGGDRRRFLRLQSNFEAAMRFIDQRRRES
jgi:hypothetical protein